MSDPSPSTEPSPTAAPSRGRRALRWAFPRPVGVGSILWAAFCCFYALAVLAVGAGEMYAVLTWDGEGGAIIPVATFLLTVPSSVLAIPAAVFENVPVFWSCLVLCGWFQAWWVWRAGIGLVRMLTANASLRRAREPVPTATT